MKDKCQLEHAEQVTLVNEFRKKYPGVLIFAIPNGGKRHISTAIKMKAEGVLPGIPDLFIPAWRCFVEMKKQKGGKVSPEQKSIMAELVRVGYACIVANGWEHGMKQLESFANP